MHRVKRQYGSKVSYLKIFLVEHVSSQTQQSLSFMNKANL